MKFRTLLGTLWLLCQEGLEGLILKDNGRGAGEKHTAQAW